MIWVWNAGKAVEGGRAGGWVPCPTPGFHPMWVMTSWVRGDMLRGARYGRGR
jgi:hypothetical protein